MISLTRLGGVRGKAKRAGLPRWAGPFYLAAGVITLIWTGVLFNDFLNASAGSGSPTRCVGWGRRTSWECDQHAQC